MISSGQITDLIEFESLVDINVIKETLTRLGIANKKKNFLFPTCYVYPNYEKNYIVHFKELFLLTRPNGYNNMSVDDYERKNSIIYCLIQWGLIKIKDEDIELIEPHNKFIYVLPYKEKCNWVIQHKFNSNSIYIPE